MISTAFSGKDFIFEELAWDIVGELNYDGKEYIEVKLKSIALHDHPFDHNLFDCLDADFIERLENAICSELLGRWITQHNWNDAL